MYKDVSIEALLSQPPKELALWLDENFTMEIPGVILTIEDMREASEKMLKLSSWYSYLSSLFTYAKIGVREMKRTGGTKNHEDMIDRKDAIEAKKKAVKQDYDAISRAVTVHIENNEELRLGRGLI